MVAVDLIAVDLDGSAGRRENISQHVTEPSHYTSEGGGLEW